MLNVGEERDQRSILRRLVELQYERNDFGVHPQQVPRARRHDRDLPRVRGAGRPHPALRRRGRAHLRASTRSPARSSRSSTSLALFPASHYVTDEERLQEAIAGIEAELTERLAELEERRQAARGAAPAHAHHLRPRDAARGRELLGRRELLDAPRRPRTGTSRRTRCSTTSPTTGCASSTSRTSRSRSCTASSRATARARRRSSSTASGCRPRWTTGRCGSRSSPSA